MGVANPFKGSRAQWLVENGWRHEVVASSGRWELRLYPDQVPPQLMIADRFSVLRAEVKIQRSGNLWLVVSSASLVPAHEPFVDPMAAFRWWVEAPKNPPAQ